MPYKLVIFDLDGTVLDTLADLRNSLNAALATKGLPLQSPAEVRSHVGNGIRRLIQDSVPKDTPEAVLEELHHAFMEHYPDHCMDETRPYAGIPELLTALRSQGVRLAMVSNKADMVVQTLCNHFFTGTFEVALGAKPGLSKKPAPDGVLSVMTALGGTTDNTLYVGDTEIDATTAKNAGIPVALVTWGFRTKESLSPLSPTYLLDNPLELLECKKSPCCSSLALNYPNHEKTIPCFGNNQL